MDLGSLQPGQTLGEEELVISQEAAEAYQAAVDDNSSLYQETHILPPMAVAALAMAATIQSLALPAGAVHTAQELAFTKVATAGVPLRCLAMVDQNTVRKGVRFLVLRMQVTHDGQVVVHGRTSLAIAEEGPF